MRKRFWNLYDYLIIKILSLWRRTLESRIDYDNFDPELSQKLDLLESLKQ